ncbi:hypothetical protein SANA_22690 [Gottschalkiaceae bacterium SANA]|nr:hypothetical protein SANA_22690 [Gottschalkiaceae bacterium SANA]
MLLEKINGFKQAIEERIDNMDGMKCGIAFKNRIEGKSLKKITEELNYSYGYRNQVFVRKGK